MLMHCEFEIILNEGGKTIDSYILCAIQTDLLMLYNTWMVYKLSF